MKKDVTEVYNRVTKVILESFPNKKDLHKSVLDAITILMYDCGEAEKESKISYISENDKFFAIYVPKNEAMKVIGSFKIVLESIKHYTTKIGVDYQFTMCDCMSCINVRAFLVAMQEIGIKLHHENMELN